MVTVVLIYSNNYAIWILLTTNNCGGLFGSFTPSVKAKVKVVAASYCGTGTGGTTVIQWASTKSIQWHFSPG